MNKQTWVLGVWFLTAIAVACSNSSPPAGTDGGPDSGLAPTDGGTDDAGQDTEAPTAMGTPTGAQQTGTIGAAGGTLTSTDGKVTLTFPAGALTADTTIGIEPITNTAPGGIEGSYLLTAGGATFAQPVQITFAFADADLAGTTLDGLGVGYQDDQGYWHTLDGVTADATAHTLTVSSTHFSPWTGLSGFQIVPPKKILTSGEGTTLFVYDCEPTGPSNLIPNGAAMPEDPCGPRPGLFSRVSNWSVDGIPGGNSKVGTVKALPNLRQAIYTAPVVSAEQVHAVSAELDRTRSRGHVTLVSNVTVEPLQYLIDAVFHDPDDEGVCPLARVDLDDAMSFEVSPDENGQWVVQSTFTNKATQVSNVTIGGDYSPGVFSWITQPEVITGTSGTATPSVDNLFTVLINGTTTAGVCQVVSSGYTFGPVAGSTFPTPISFDFSTTAFDANDTQHVGQPGELWQYTITKL